MVDFASMSRKEITRFHKTQHRSPVQEFWMLWLGPNPFLAFGLLFAVPPSFLNELGVVYHPLFVWMGLSLFGLLFVASAWYFVARAKTRKARFLAGAYQNWQSEQREKETRMKVEAFVAQEKEAGGQ